MSKPTEDMVFYRGIFKLTTNQAIRELRLPSETAKKLLDASGIKTEDVPTYGKLYNPIDILRLRVLLAVYGSRKQQKTGRLR